MPLVVCCVPSLGVELGYCQTLVTIHHVSGRPVQSVDMCSAQLVAREHTWDHVYHVQTCVRTLARETLSPQQ